jgi:hypothetical protein
MARQQFQFQPAFQGYKVPFAHSDETFPERRLRFKLQEFCRAKNDSIRQQANRNNNFGGGQRRYYNGYNSNGYGQQQGLGWGFVRPPLERYTSIDGLKLYKVSHHRKLSCLSGDSI